MKTFEGTSVSKGIAIGKAIQLVAVQYDCQPNPTADPDKELVRFREALETAKGQLADLYETALESAGEETAEIFSIHQMLLEDDDLIEAIEGGIASREGAEYSVMTQGENFAAIFEQMDDEYMQARSADIRDITKRVLNILMGIEDRGLDSKEPVVIMAKDLTPSDTIKLDKALTLGFVTMVGSATSHTAILARALGVPALIVPSMPETISDGTYIIDGIKGLLIEDPDEDTLQEYVKIYDEQKAMKEALLSLKGLENVTKDGRSVRIYANIGDVDEADIALENDAGGVGLFRSEFLYMGRDQFPDEEEQFRSYKAVLEKFGDRQVVIRTLDIGADKKIDYFKMDDEENPAMGIRAIRLCLNRTDIFKTQLKALLRAAVYGNLGIMFPMIVSLNEIMQIKGIIEEVKEELTREGKAYGQFELGIMVETPAAAVISDILAREVDFFSIGTNDLTQYTLAADRQNPKMDPFVDSHHEAVLRLIQMTAENAHKEGKWVGICGELAADEALTERFIDMGIDELSVSSSRILALRQVVRNIG